MPASPTRPRTSLSSSYYPLSTAGAAASFYKNPVTVTLKNCWSHSQKSGQSKGLAGGTSGPTPQGISLKLHTFPGPREPTRTARSFERCPAQPARPFTHRPVPPCVHGPLNGSPEKPHCGLIPTQGHMPGQRARPSDSSPDAEDGWQRMVSHFYLL